MTQAAPGTSRDSLVRLFSDALGGRAAVAVFAIINIAIVARGVGPAIYGVYATATAFATLLYFFTDLGSSNVVVRETGHPASAPRAVATYLQARALLIALTCVGGASLVPLIFESDERLPAFLALGVLVFSGPSIASPLGQVYGSMRLYRLSATLQGFIQLLLTAGIIFIVDEPSATLLVAALVIACAVATIWVFLRLRSTISGLPSGVDRGSLRSMLWSVGLIGLSGVLVTIYYRIDGLLLLRLRGAEEAGLYAAAYRLMDQAKILPAVLLIPVAPLLAREFAAHGRFRAIVDEPLLKLSVLAGVGLSTLTAALAPLAVTVLMGDAFDETTILFEILLISLAWSPLGFVLGSKAITARRERPYLAIAALGVIVNVGLNLALIPKWGARGAAAATIATELSTVSAMGIVTRGSSDTAQFQAILVCIFVGAAAAAVALGRGLVAQPLQIVASVLLAAVGVTALVQAFRLLRSGRLEPV